MLNPMHAPLAQHLTKRMDSLDPGIYTADSDTDAYGTLMAIAPRPRNGKSARRPGEEAKAAREAAWRKANSEHLKTYFKDRYSMMKVERPEKLIEYAEKNKAAARIKKAWRTKRAKRYMKKYRKTPNARDDKARHDRAYREKNAAKLREQRKSYHLRKRYGMTVEERATLEMSHGGRCPICDLSLVGNGDVGVDHDHRTGAVRGILHNNCNLIIGSVDDRVEDLRRAVAYLREHGVVS